MPAQARRISLPRAARIGIATAVTGVSFALPLVTAMSAQAQTAPAAPAAAAAPVAQNTTWTGATSVDAKPAAAAPAQAAQTEESYRVVRGDSLSKIAEVKHVEGGWHALYDHNRSVVGANPNLIFPGQKLAIAGHAAAPAAAPAAPAAAPAEKPAAPAAPAPQAQTAPAKPAAPAQVQVKTAAAKPAQAVTAAPAAVASTSGYVAPLAHPVLGEAYGVAGSMWASGHHTGQDFVASTGTPLLAVANGVVVKAGNGGAYGNEVEIKLADGKYAQYAHLSVIGVKIGQTVTVGQQLGLSGATGNVTGPHLHFEIRTGPEYGSDIDPVAYLRAHGVAL
ncbi:peptidoglycan DD-metalloendopeptidase family protein [Streptomyces kaniharaensis]|uniref:Peptidoglycan DD-metalloendopeptidase family protein n=1 Tax=Streptomyces kaniharaensis TaxID=212423 RepID=A0A6N7KYH2_9ACTN|nr:LysM peptidoglycan-binding domain-containing M23 family metallopeptidase [Streptomyces kaniharaensis]MQS15407.1 peptidoglycan DD-metalloendopeptidase family protein [Streptomyces kaniharaensis]